MVVVMKFSCVGMIAIAMGLIATYVGMNFTAAKQNATYVRMIPIAIGLIATYVGLISTAVKLAATCVTCFQLL